MWEQLLEQLKNGNIKALARAISYIENEQQGYGEMLSAIPSDTSAKIIGITGPPGAGKSTVVDGLIGEITRQGKKVAVLCVDPSSPFNLGAVLGDRIRMSEWYTHAHVFIRSLATRGSLGGLHPKILEITELVKAAGFDYVIVETVGVGQSEVEISGLADATVVVLVPEAGDEVQTMKAGLMEIADIFVINKSDRPGADLFSKNLRLMLAGAFGNHKQEVPVIKAIASQRLGLDELHKAINAVLQEVQTSEKRYWLLTEKVYHLVQQQRMKSLSKQAILEKIWREAQTPDFNLYKFAATLV
ncbi:MAG TPA: methylmalonyl Co-A mutase-associated GTPase MeaB [Flavisolibacter sp.]|nr:methylmalonyl Co-A mutase-associated GTPase MeaB [Flavisolibacter sp.]